MARLPPMVSAWAVAKTTRRWTRRRLANANAARTRTIRIVRMALLTGRSPAEDELVDDPVGGAAVVVGEMAGGEVGDLVRLVVVAPDGVEHVRERPHDLAR